MSMLTPHKPHLEALSVCSLQLTQSALRFTQLSVKSHDLRHVRYSTVNSIGFLHLRTWCEGEEFMQA